MKSSPSLFTMALALAVLMVATPANAQVVYSGADRNIVYDQHNYPGVISLFDAPDTWDDIRLYLDISEDPTFQNRYAFHTMLQIHGNYVEFADGSEHLDIKRYTRGQVIGPAATYTGDKYRYFSYYLEMFSPFPSVSENGEFRNQTGYAGMRMVDGADQYYGWIQISVTSDNNAGLTGTLIDWAYNSVPGRPILAGSLLNVEPLNGPHAGGNQVQLTDTGLPLGDGGDITNVLVGGVSAAILGQDVHEITFVTPPGMAAGSADVAIQSASLGETLYPAAYTYNPAGRIGITEYGPYGWTNLAGGMNNNVRALLHDGETLYAGGIFTTADGIEVNRITMWNGTNWTNLGDGMASGVTSLAHDGTNLYAGGQFTSAAGVEANRVAMWNGTSWTNLGSGLDSIVNALVHDGVHLYAGGFFENAGGVSANYVAMWNGTSWTNLGSGLETTVNALVHDGEHLYAGGFFTNACGVTANYVAMWDGTSWTGLGSGLGSTVNALAHDGENLYAGGPFSSAGGVAASRVAMWNGMSWTNLGDGVNNSAWALTHDGENLYAGGFFTTAGGQPANRVAMWDGVNWTNLGTGATEALYVLVNDGINVYAGGMFTNAGGVAASRVAMWGPSEVIEYPGVSPESGPVAGGYEVVISGANLGHGGDITNVTLVGTSVADIVSQSSTQIVVVAGQAAAAGLGDVRVFSTSFGETVKSNAFTYRLNAPIQYDPVGITPSNLVARWQPVSAADTHFLDVALDTNFTLYLDGYEQREVFGVGQYMVTGLTEGAWYAIRLYAEQEGVLSEPSRTVWVPAGSSTPYEVHPPFSGPISEGAISEFDLSHIFHGAGHDYDAWSSDIEVMEASITGNGFLRLNPVGPGTATITVTATDLVTGYTATYSFSVQVVGDPTELSRHFKPREPWNPRFEQVLELRNDAGVDAIGVRVLFSDLRPGITVENQTGVAWDGRPMIEMETPFNDGDTLELVMVYVCTGAFRVDQHPPTIELQYILPTWRPPLPGEGVAVGIKAVLPDGRIVLEFDTVPGVLYAIEYMNNFPDGVWVEVPLRIRAGANRTQWIDSGPPATLPVKGVRAYRVKQLLD